MLRGTRFELLLAGTALAVILAASGAPVYAGTVEEVAIEAAVPVPEPANLPPPSMADIAPVPAQATPAASVAAKPVPATQPATGEREDEEQHRAKCASQGQFSRSAGQDRD